MPIPLHRPWHVRGYIESIASFFSLIVFLYYNMQLKHRYLHPMYVSVVSLFLHIIIKAEDEEKGGQDENKYN